MLIISSQWKPCTVTDSYLEIINMSVTLFCHGKAGWKYTVLALRGGYIVRT